MTRTEDNAKTAIRTAEQRATSSRVLGRISLLPIAAAAVMGWSASFIGLHGFAYRQMTGFTTDTAWLVPGAIDLSALGCTILVYRASINGRSGFASRVLMYLFTALSAWVNWIHQVGGPARFVACVLPVSAVVVFDRLAGEIRADWEADHGRKAFRMRLPLLMLRWLVDRAGTREAFRDQIRSIPVSALVGLGADLATAASGIDHAEPADVQESEPVKSQESETVPAQRTKPEPDPDSMDAIKRLLTGNTSPMDDVIGRLLLAEPPEWESLTIQAAIERADAIVPGGPRPAREMVEILARVGVKTSEAYVRTVRGRVRDRDADTVVIDMTDSDVTEMREPVSA
jgi:hypothetical protein